MNLRRSLATDAHEVKLIETESGLAPWRESDYRDEASRENSIFLVAAGQDPKSIAGYIIVRLITNLFAPSKPLHAISEAEILNLAVRPACRRAGIARALLTEAVRSLPDPAGTHLFLEVRCSNLPAIEFYRGFGFRSSGLRRAFYANPVEDALLMESSGDKVLARNPPDGVVFDL